MFGGIDVGKNGGIAIITKEGLKLHTIPKIGNKVDYLELNGIFNDLPKSCIFCIEDVHSIFGSSAKSNFNFGEIKGILTGMVISNGFRWELVQPKKWQKEVWTNADMVKKPNGRTDTKGTSLLAAKRIFPDQTFLATQRSRKPHDGLFDASLIAEYCRRTYS